VTLPGSELASAPFRSGPAPALPGTYASGDAASTAPADIVLDKKVLRFIDSCSSAQNFFQVLKTSADSFGRVAGFRFVFDVCRVRPLKPLHQLHRFGDRSRTLAKSLLTVLGILVAVLQMEAHDAFVMFANKRHRIKTRSVEVTDVQVYAQVFGSTLECGREIFRRFKFLCAVALEPFLAEPVIVQP